MTVNAYSLIYNFVADKLVEADYSVKRTSKKLKASKDRTLVPPVWIGEEATPQVFSILHAKHNAQTTASFLKRLKNAIHLTRRGGSKTPQCLSSQH